LLRRNARFERKVEELGRELKVRQEAAIPDVDAGDSIDDDLLRLMFVACHPVLSTAARVALTLRLLGRLRTDESARALPSADPAGEPILLLDQNRARCDQLLIRRGLVALRSAEKLGGALGPYGLQAAIAACHARARFPEETDWERIVALYDALAQLAPSPVVELNRAVALAMAFGPAAGLELVDSLTDEPALKDYHLL